VPPHPGDHDFGVPSEKKPVAQKHEPKTVENRIK